MKTIQLYVQIDVDEKRIADLYPEYSEQFDSLEDFIQAVKDSIQTVSPDTLDTLGYQVKILEKVFLLPITFKPN